MPMSTDDPPKLACPSCGTGLIPPHGRGRYDDDGNYIEHRDGCRCPWCEWMWFDDTDPVHCECGAHVLVRVDDDHAYAAEENEGTGNEADV